MTMAVLSRAVLFLFSSLSAKVLSAFMSTHSVFLNMEKKVLCTAVAQRTSDEQMHEWVNEEIECPEMIPPALFAEDPD